MRSEILAGGFEWEAHFTADSGERFDFPTTLSATTAYGPFGVILAISTFKCVDSPHSSLVGATGSFVATSDQGGRHEERRGGGELLAMTDRIDFEGVTRALYVFGPKCPTAEAIASDMVAAWMAETMLPPLKKMLREIQKTLGRLGQGVERSSFG